MDKAEQMFGWGAGLLIAVVMLTAVLQVAFRVQNNALVRAGRGIDETRQQIDIASANFSAFVRPEILRGIVSTINPRVEPISFNKSISVDEIQ
ncbi:MAG: hypothetical protein LBR41_02330 [Rickettsiales bacterium]|jgi:hypothetical protein|nr:hypothetical protein [Rickettsiales bacterium]